MAAEQKKMNATQLLAADHREVEALFEKFENARGERAKEQLVQQICMELKIHAMIEEEIFYPAIRGKVEDDMLDEAYVEHDGAKMLINELEASAPDEDFYDAKVKVLKEEIEHHVYEEERMNDSMFAQARKADVDLDMLGEQMMARKMELMEMAKSQGLPPAQPSTMGEQPSAI
jgi:hemerythrin superfamily protein